MMKPSRKLLLHSGIVVAAIVVLLLVGTAVNRGHPDGTTGPAGIQLTFLVLILAAGMTGGIVANYMRLREVDGSDKLFSDPEMAYRVQVQMYVGPLVSGVFAGVLYSLFASGLITGALFPAFDGGTADFGTPHPLSVAAGEITADSQNLLRRFFKGIYPKTNMDGVKVVFWSFLAGYSERFVPNILDKMAAQAMAERSENDPA